MPTVDEAIANQLRNIEGRYGKTLDQWIALIQDSGKTKHSEIMAFLKADYGVSHGDANRLALQFKSSETASAVSADPLDEIYAGKKAGLRPIHDALMAAVGEFGNDIEIAPKKGYISLRRKKQFAMLQPTTATRVDVGLNLKGVPTTERLEDGSGFNAMFTHRVRIGALAEVDDELLGWLRQAYVMAG